MAIAPIPTTMIVHTATITATPVIKVSPIIQILQDHPAIINGFDVHQLIGLGVGTTGIEAFVKYLQNQWKLPKTGLIPVIITFICAMLLNLLVAWYLHLDITNAILVGAFTGMAANGWHEVQKLNQ